MSPVVLAFDLDGTLLHSKRDWCPGDICVESTTSGHRGFMKQEVASAVQYAKQYSLLLPVTSRSAAQYSRLLWKCAAPSEAYIDNGSKIIKMNRSVEFVDNAEALIKPYLPHLLDAVSTLSHSDGVRSARIVDGCYASLLLVNRGRVTSEIADYCKRSPLQLCVDAGKVFLFPPGLSKSLAIASIRERHASATVICAGDSINDCAMAAVSDHAILPEDVAVLFQKEYPNTSLSICPQGESFETFIAKWLMENIATL